MKDFPRPVGTGRAADPNLLIKFRTLRIYQEMKMFTDKSFLWLETLKTIN